MEYSWLVIDRQFVVDKYEHIKPSGKRLIKCKKPTVELLEFVKKPDPQRIVFDRSLEPVLDHLRKKPDEAIQNALKRRRRVVPPPPPPSVKKQ